MPQGNDYSWRYGMITPDGHFYGCEYMGHADLAETLIDEIGFDGLLGTIIFNGLGATVEGYGGSHVETDYGITSLGPGGRWDGLFTSSQLYTLIEIIKYKVAIEDCDELYDGAIDALEFFQQQLMFKEYNNRKEQLSKLKEPKRGNRKIAEA